MSRQRTPRQPATDLTVWERAAAHYRRLANRDPRPGIRQWAADRAADCMANARRAQRNAA